MPFTYVLKFYRPYQSAGLHLSQQVMPVEIEDVREHVCEGMMLPYTGHCLPGCVKDFLERQLP